MLAICHRLDIICHFHVADPDSFFSAQLLLNLLILVLHQQLHMLIIIITNRCTTNCLDDYVGDETE